MQNTKYHVLIIGGGAAGFFAAINAAEFNPDLRIAILEQSNKVLSKVKISGGGRCNVTHAEFDPMELVKHYPRGHKELLGPFHRFMTGDVMKWFAAHGVDLKIENDGRVFPVSNHSQTIIDCFLKEAVKRGVDVILKQSVKGFEKKEGHWLVQTKSASYNAGSMLVASGSNNRIWKILSDSGHTVIAPAPSLFTFNINDKRIKDLPGLSRDVVVHIIDHHGKTLLKSHGPLLITHWGMSGPAILKLSAWGARILAQKQYQFEIEINWLIDQNSEQVIQTLTSKKKTYGKKKVVKDVVYDIPRRLWKNLVAASGIAVGENWGDLSKVQMLKLADELTHSRFAVSGKSTFKEEFVTAGGVELSEVDFNTFESKIHPGLYFAGEVLNIDAITGGFNFQSAWTSGYLAAKSIASIHMI